MSPRKELPELSRHDTLRKGLPRENPNPHPLKNKLVYCKTWQVDSLRIYGNTVATKEQFKKFKQNVIDELQKLSLSVMLYKTTNGTYVISTPERMEEIGV